MLENGSVVRVKKIFDGKWITGFYLLLDNGQCFVGLPSSQKADNNNLVTHWKWKEVDPDTICRYAGISDKNGTAMFEHDVCRYYDEAEIDNHFSLKKLCYQEEKRKWVLAGLNESDHESLIPMSRSCIEVVGNIFDNKSGHYHTIKIAITDEIRKMVKSIVWTSEE